MAWPFRSHRRTEPCPAIGQYRIDMRIDDIKGFFSLSSEELVALNPEVKFEDEQILHAPDAEFMDLSWDTILGLVDGAIYKISIQLTGARAEVGRVQRQLIIYCTKHYGKGNNTTLWDCSDGNIVLYANNFGSQAMLNVFVTSAKVSQFKRI
jgi:hypothetical protein